MKTIMFPGQGSQYKGMGQELFDKYPEETQSASRILGYDIKDLCLNDREKKLNQTQFTQPALYVVNALGFKEYIKNNLAPDYLIGHSLGEYNALLASGVFDFETGLKLVKKGGELMAEAKGGAMAVLLGTNIQIIEKILNAGHFREIDVANYNTPNQTVISGPEDSIVEAIKHFEKEKVRTVQLNVSAAFHSRYMKNASDEFASFLKPFHFSSMKIPVIANSSAKPYENEQIASILSEQIHSPVLWTDSVSWLINQEVECFEEIGGTFLSRMVTEIKDNVGKEEVNKIGSAESGKTERKRRIFMLPFAGGNRYSYQFMAPYFKDFDIHALELPGRGKRIKEPLLKSFFDALGDIYRQISAEIEPGYDIIYGHSLGAILGHWVTYRLEKAGKSPASLVVSGISEPNINRAEVFQLVHELPQKEFIERLIRIGGMPKGFMENKELFEYSEPILRADFEVLDSIGNFKSKKTKSSLTAIMGTKESTAHQIKSWQNYTEGELDYHYLEGDHFFINQHPKIMAELISKSFI